MKTKSNIKKTWLGTLFVVVLVAAAMSVTVFAGDAEAAEHTSKMYATAWSLVPPLVAIILALITKEVYSSLFIGIVVGGLFYANFSPKLTYLTIFTDITDGGMLAKLSDSDNVGILIFLVILGIMVALMNKAGGSAAYGRWAVKAIKTRKGALLSTFLLGVLVFVDYVWDKAKEDRTQEKAIFIDEVWQLIGASSNRLAAEFVLEIFKIIRGYGGAAICATQDINDFLSLDDGKYGKGIINNSKTKIVLNLEDEEAQRVQHILNLSDTEIMNITHFARGNGLILTNNNTVTVEFKASGLETEMITTDREQLREMIRRKQE